MDTIPITPTFSRYHSPTSTPINSKSPRAKAVSTPPPIRIREPKTNSSPQNLIKAIRCSVFRHSCWTKQRPRTASVVRGRWISAITIESDDCHSGNTVKYSDVSILNITTPLINRRSGFLYKK